MGRSRNRNSNNKHCKPKDYAYSEPETLDIETQVKYQEFIDSTVDKDTFIIQNVAEDNACFYRAVSNGLFHIVNSTGDTGSEVLYSIGNWKPVINSDNTFRNKLWGYNGSEQTYLAKKMQIISRQWIVKHYKKDVAGIPSYRVIDLVRDSHGMDISDDEVTIALYDECYSKFAGAPRKIKQKLIPKTLMNVIDTEEDITMINEEFEPIGECMIDSDTEDKPNKSNEEQSEDYQKKDVNEYLFEEQSDTQYNEEDPDYIPDITVDIDNDIESYNEEIDIDMEEEDDFGLDETSDNHKMLKQQIRDTYDLSERWDRWGSGAEAYALSQFFKVPIVVYAPKRFNFKTHRIENGRMYKTVKPDRNVRFQVLQIWGSEFQNIAPPIELLYRKMKGNIEHYMILYRL